MKSLAYCFAKLSIAHVLELEATPLPPPPPRTKLAPAALGAAADPSASASADDDDQQHFSVSAEVAAAVREAESIRTTSRPASRMVLRQCFPIASPAVSLTSFA